MFGARAWEILDVSMWSFIADDSCRRGYPLPIVVRNCFLAWLIPGLGHWLLGRRRSAVLIGLSLYGGFLLGVVSNGDLFPFLTEGKIRTAGFFLQSGMGAPYGLAKAFLARATPLSPLYDYGTGYFLMTGLINWLTVFDVFDISVNRK